MVPVRLAVTARQAWGDWLALAPWDVFVTLTDPGFPHPETMVKRTRYLEAKVNDSLYGKGWKRRGRHIEAVTGLERQKRGSVHTHALWRLPDHDARDRRQFSLAHWQSFASELGGFAWLQVPTSQADVVRYVSKYVVKDGELILGEGFNPWAGRTYSASLLAAGAPPSQGVERRRQP